MSPGEEAVLALALRHEGELRHGAVVVPATTIVAFLNEAAGAGVDIGYIDCLYIGRGFTEPSMELSAEIEHFATRDAFVAFAKAAATTALERARLKGAKAVFEVG